MTAISPVRAEVASPAAPWPAGTTILDVLADRTGAAGDRVALRARDERNTWRSTTWVDYGRVIAEVAAGLHTLGVEAGDRVAILS